MSPAEPVAGRPARRHLSRTGVLGELLLTAGVFVLLFAAWQFWWTDVSADSAQQQDVAALEHSFAGAAPAANGGLLAGVPAPGTQFAVVRIPRFGADYARPLVAGTDTEELRRGVGWDPDSAVPGAVGNLVTAGHRVTYGKPYRHIEQLRPDDAAVVETRAGWAVYRVARSRIVAPDATEVMAPVPERPRQAPTQAWLTMIACDPPFSARARYVVFAVLERVVPRSAGPPTTALTAPAAD